MPELAAAAIGETIALVVSLLVSLTAVGIAATSLWLGALKPAEITFDQLPGPRSENEGIAGGGMNEIPSLYDVHLGFALTNAGARAALLESVQVESVRAIGAPDFATGALPPRHADAQGPVVIETGLGQLELPRTIEAGDVRSIELKFELAGAFKSEATTQYLQTPSREPLAQMVADLERVEITVGWRYRRRIAVASKLRGPAHGTCEVVIPGSAFRRLAIAHWQGGWPTLAAIVAPG